MTSITLKSSICLASLCAFNFGCVEAKDSLVDGEDVQRLIEILDDMGFEPSARTTEQGLHAIDLMVEGVNSTLTLNNCEHDNACGVATLTSGYDLEDGVTDAKLAEWNGNKLFVTAYVDDENDPFIDMTVNLKYGVSEQNFRDTIDWWRVIKSEFESHIEFK